jgi:predicted nucleotidyltransferase
MDQPHRAVLQQLVDRARDLPGIAAIGAYGSSASETWTAYSDLDLILIVNQGAPVNSIHVFLHGIPLDLNLKQRESWIRGDYGWLPPGEVVALWDPEGLFGDLPPPSTVASSDARQYRYAHRHRLLKLMKVSGMVSHPFCDLAMLLKSGGDASSAVTFNPCEARHPLNPALCLT